MRHNMQVLDISFCNLAVKELILNINSGNMHDVKAMSNLQGFQSIMNVTFKDKGYKKNTFSIFVAALKTEMSLCKNGVTSYFTERSYFSDLF